MKELTREEEIKQIEEMYKNIKLEKLRCLELFEKYRNERPCEFVRFYKWQLRVLAEIPYYNVIVVAGPNKIGKTCLISNAAISWLEGYEPWTRTEKQLPGYIKGSDGWYRPSTLGKEPPVRIRITGNDWRSHINETIVPEFLKWMPKEKYETRSDNGAICKIIWHNGSTIEFLSHQEHKQENSPFESWIGDAWIPDEPPKKEIFDAMGRGLFLTGGKVLMFTTLLTQPWIVDTLIEPEVPRSDVYVVDDLTFLDNDDLKEHDTDLLLKAGLSKYQVGRYFELLLDFENKTKPEHLTIVNDYLKKCILN